MSIYIISTFTFYSPKFKINPNFQSSGDFTESHAMSCFRWPKSGLDTLKMVHSLSTSSMKAVVLLNP